MKLQGRAIDDFIARPGAGTRAVLVYGPDEGLVHERSHAIARAVVPDAADPFRIADLAADQIIADTARLVDETNSLSLMGGKRLVHIREATDKIAAACAALASETTAPDCLVIVEAGDLNPRSALRKLFEGEAAFAALACYIDDEKTLSALIRESLRAERIVAEPDALAYLARALSGDRALARRALEKLVLYIGPEARDRTLTLDQAAIAVGDAGALDLDDPARAAADGDRAATDRAMRRLMEDGISTIAMLRSAQGYFRRLHLARGMVSQGHSADAAMAALRPPVFFKQAPQFRRQLDRWQLPMIGIALARLVECEAAAKRTGAADELLAAPHLHPDRPDAAYPSLAFAAQPLGLYPHFMTAQPLYFVFGGELTTVGSTEFRDPAELHLVGVFADYPAAHSAWSAAARATIDDAQMRYFITDLRTAMVSPVHS